MSEEEHLTVFDPIRRQRVRLTPEERVRQAMVHALVHDYGYPPELMANEVTITVGKVTRRCDTVVYSRDRTPLMILEYKAPRVDLNEKVVLQAFQYNSVLCVPVIVLANGPRILAYRIGYNGDSTTLLSDFPSYEALLEMRLR